MRIKNKIIGIEKSTPTGVLFFMDAKDENPPVSYADSAEWVPVRWRHCRRNFVYCNLSVKIGCLLQLQQAADKVDYQPKGGQQTHGGQYKKNLISIAQGGQRHQREQGAHRQLYPADHGL